MRGRFARFLIRIAILSSIAAYAQDVTTFRVGVPLLRAAPKTVSSAEARDRLVKSLNQHKPDKKEPFQIVAVPLETEWGSKAWNEAKGKNCQFVLSTHLTDLQTASESSFNGTGIDYVPDYLATVEYRLIRVPDGAGFAIGSVQEEDPSSAEAAVWLALNHVVPQALNDISKGGNVPHTPAGEAGAAAPEVRPGGDETFNSVPKPCAWLPDSIPHGAAVRAICEYAMSLPTKMPNFICDQDASRYRGKNKVPFDLIRAQIRYEDGRESYQAVQRNGKPAPEAMTQTPGLWSTGQFGSNLRSIFDPWNQAVFAFAKENKVGERSVWVFTYRILKQNDPLWRLHGNNTVLAPPYRGELWVDEKTGALLRFTSSATDIPVDFPMASADLQIDYANVAFADGSLFLLPSDFTLTTAYRREEATRNVVQFRSCHKFRATTQMLLNIPGTSSGESSPAKESDSAAATRETEQSEELYAILREQAVREDDAGIGAERSQELNTATGAAFSRLGQLEQQRKRAAEQLEANAKATSPAPETKVETTIKVSVKFVPVSVVLMDSKGKPVGNLRKEDFRLFDNGVPQAITRFSVEKTGAPAAPAQSSAPNRAEPAAEPAALVPADRSVAYVFDDIHAAFEDLASARAAAERHLAALGPSDRAGVFTTSGQVGLDFTASREKLRGALEALRPHPIKLGVACPPVSPYMADLIINQNDLEALELATKDADTCAYGGAHEYALAERLAKQTAMTVVGASSAENQSILSVLRDIFRRTESAAGRRSIVLASPGFLMLTPETRQAVMDLIDEALRAEIVVNVLDIHGLSVPIAAPNSMHPSDPVLRFRYDREEEGLKNDLMADLAYSTGGTFFHNSNDLDEGFRRTADSPEYIFILGFSPQKLDGKFHKLKVRLNTPEKLTIQAREGYYALKPKENR